MESEMSSKLYSDWNALGAGVRPARPSIIDMVGDNAFIGATKNGIEGATIFGRSFSMQVTQYMSPKKLTYAYVRLLTRLIATLNDRDFFGFAPGSMLFRGYTLAGHLYQNIPVTFSFDHKANFRFSESLPTLLANTQDERNSSGKLVTDYQFDILNEPEFKDTIIGYRGSPSPDFGAQALLVTHPTGSKSEPILYRATNNQEKYLLSNYYWPYNGINDINGVHSGWSIIDYKYAETIDAGVGSSIKTPTYRTILQPYEYSNFRAFKL